MGLFLQKSPEISAGTSAYILERSYVLLRSLLACPDVWCVSSPMCTGVLDNKYFLGIMGLEFFMQVGPM